MKKMNKHIEIVSSTRKGLSSMSKLPREAIKAVLVKHYTTVGITLVNNLADLEALVARKPDLVFLGMKYIPFHPELGTEDPDKIWISEYLDRFSIPYTGSSAVAHSLEADKPQAKKQVLAAGLKTAQYEVIKQNERYDSDKMVLAFPVFIKPTNRGGGQGVDSNSVANNMTELRAKVQLLANTFNADSLVEEYLPGREFSVAILKKEHLEDYLIMPLERVVPCDVNGSRILSSQMKLVDAGQTLAVTDVNLKSKVAKLAFAVFCALGARDLGRIDIRLDKNGVPHFLEANLIPSLVEGDGNFPKACILNKNLRYEAMILHIVRLGLTRCGDYEANDQDDSKLFSPRLKIAFEAVV